MKSEKLLKNSRSIRIFDGKGKADEILSELEKKIKELKIKPSLAIISIGSDPASNLFIKNKKKAAKKIGIKIRHFKFKETAPEEKVIQKIKILNDNASVSGLIVQLPLPKGFNQDKIIKTISPKKDVDGFLKNSSFQPVLPSAIFLILKSMAKFPNKGCLEPGSKRLKSCLDSKKILALVNSEFFGRTLQEFLRKKKISVSYIVRKKVSQRNLTKRTKQADIIITVCGKPNLIKGKIIKKGAILIDAGIVLKSKNKIVGDVDIKSAKEKAGFLTPVPGGIGPLTVALLLKNTYLAAACFFQS